MKCQTDDYVGRKVLEMQLRENQIGGMVMSRRRTCRGWELEKMSCSLEVY